MKTEKELNELKEEYTELNKKLAELSEDELKMVTGGSNDNSLYSPTGDSWLLL